MYVLKPLSGQANIGNLKTSATLFKVQKYINARFEVQSIRRLKRYSNRKSITGVVDCLLLWKPDLTNVE